ncbi:MAG: N4-gp56 family major capsid protein [Pseudomonadota bacterium]
MANATYGDIGTRTAAYAEKKFLTNAERVEVLAKLGLVRAIPKNSTDTIKFRRSVLFSPATTPLVEGVTPTPGAIQFVDVTGQVSQYGDLYGITDHVDDMSEDPVLNEMMELAGEQAGQTLEQIIYGAVKAGTSVYYANGASRAAVNTAYSLDDQRKAIRYLKSQNAKKFTSILAPGVNKIGTTPIEAAYVGVCHTDLEADIRSLAGFTPVAEYGSMKPMCAEEFGAVEDVRYVCSPQLDPWADAGGTPGSAVLSTSGSAADVYPILIFGKEAFGTVALRGAKSMKPTVINPGRVDKSDPLGQRGYVGWKTYFLALILNQTWMTRIEVGASAL